MFKSIRNCTNQWYHLKGHVYQEHIAVVPRKKHIFARQMNGFSRRLKILRPLHILKARLKSFSGRLTETGRWDESNNEREIQQTQMMLLVLSGQVHQQNDS